MEREMRKQYMVLVDFLGRVLGPDYEVALHELNDDSNEIIAIVNGHLTERQLGCPLRNKTLEFVTSRLYETQDYVTQFETTSIHGKKFCSNTMFIKGEDGELAGLLCINFDASRYDELSKRVAELCASVPQVKESSGQYLSEETSTEQAPAYPTSIAGATASIVSEVVANYPVAVDRLTQDEKMEIMNILSRKGVFLLKGSVSYVAKELHSSEASIYRYLGKLNNKDK